MTCNTCAPYGALTGRVVVGRNTPGENIRPGVPLTDAQRAQRHYQQFGNTNLPARGTGLGINTAGTLDATNFLQGLTVGFLISVFVMTATGRGVARAAGTRIQRKIEYGRPKKA